MARCMGMAHYMALLCARWKEAAMDVEAASDRGRGEGRKLINYMSPLFIHQTVSIKICLLLDLSLSTANDPITAAYSFGCLYFDV